MFSMGKHKTIIKSIFMFALFFKNSLFSFEAYRGVCSLEYLASEDYMSLTIVYF